ncbi:uncharacterized protein LOC119450568 [Dermacentor silvarum]|uniref:uncharacterized protein LOC119450568 n=1 Tax=Dermacentor silvarum TaxID=543639 RepID=UPI001898D5BA|nr:uncharacterized protein LOC119450568 [Dermacentor silvarum]XP_037569997.1 uncharacterized protein LOC119450568 [Dermacentor silvarum]XP_037569998.1 uncharacterized protein LOC119450568 [Dermacentor silvarum]
MRAITSALAVALVAIAPIVVDAGFGAIAKIAAKVPSQAVRIGTGVIERVPDMVSIGMDLAGQKGQTSGSNANRLNGESGGSNEKDCGECSCNLNWQKKELGQQECKIEAEFECTCNANRCSRTHVAHCIANLAS